MKIFAMMPKPVVSQNVSKLKLNECRYLQYHPDQLSGPHRPD